MQEWKNGRVIEEEVSVDDIWWNGDDINEWGFDDGKGYAYKNVRNNRKLDDLITRDDNGNVIAPSERFNSRKSDVRFRESEDVYDAGRRSLEETLAGFDRLVREEQVGRWLAHKCDESNKQQSF